MQPYVIYFYGSGLAFFVGVGLILLAISMVSVRRSRLLLRLAPIVAIIGVALVGLSATPLPYWFYTTAGLVTMAWLFTERWGGGPAPTRVMLIRLTAALIWIIALGMELPFHLTPASPTTGTPALWIIGDSVAAGVGDPKTQTWPKLLASKQGIAIHDHSKIGGTVASALRRLDNEPVGEGIVLLEIGGNDLMGNTPTSEFEENLRRLLTEVCKPGRQVLMFEWPLPPFRNDYGIAQRRLAAQYGVTLIPKRDFVQVLTTSDATIDSIHLTQQGHELMAELVWSIVRPAFGK